MSAIKKETPLAHPAASKNPSVPCSTHKCSSEKMQHAECAMTKNKPHKPSKTRILIQYDCGFGNKLFIRGEGISTLSWDKGEPMTNSGPSEWVWETDRPFSVAKFKVLLNDLSYEQGENHNIAYGKEIAISPAF
jgi:hypothetical protein